MRTLVLVLAILVASPAFADVPLPPPTDQPKPTLALTPDDFASWQQINGVMATCVGEMELGQGSTTCKGLTIYLQRFAKRVLEQAPKQ